MKKVVKAGYNVQEYYTTDYLKEAIDVMDAMSDLDYQLNMFSSMY